MMKPLRKRHLQVWILFAVLVPAGIISGYRAVPQKTCNKLPGETRPVLLPILINKQETKDHTVYLRRSGDGKRFQLQWESIRSSTQASSLIYQLNADERELIGRVGTTGSFLFPVKTDSSGRFSFIVYDIIHQQTTDSIKF